MTLTEAQREIETGRFTVDGLKWLVLHMASDRPDRYAEATAALREHVTVYPESRERLTVQPIQNGGKCCTDGIVCVCTVRSCSCTCSGCWCN